MTRLPTSRSPLFRRVGWAALFLPNSNCYTAVMYWWLGIIVASALIGAIFFTNAGQYLKTIVLILRVSPYEQTGTGAGSIYVIGDSTGYGTGVTNSSESVAGRLGGAYPSYQITNNSANGRRIAGAQAVARELTGTHNLILLQIGANDLLSKRPVEAVVADMEVLLELLQPHAEEVVILTAGNIGGAPRFSGAESDTYRDASRRYTEQMLTLTEQYPNVTFVPLYDEPADDPFVQNPSTFMAWDGLHPTGAGYEVWFQKAAPALKAALPQ